MKNSVRHKSHIKVGIVHSRGVRCLERLTFDLKIDALDEFPSLQILKSTDSIPINCRGLSGFCLVVFRNKLICCRYSAEYSGTTYRSCQRAVSECAGFLESAVRIQVEIIIYRVLVRSVLALRVHLDEFVGS